MLWQVALFEFRYQLRQPVFLIVFGVFFLLAFGAMASDSVNIAGSGAENFNSPYRVMLSVMVMSLFGIFIVAAFVSSIVLRDFESRSAEIVFSTPIRKHEYLLGRFLGAFAVACLAFSAVAWGSMAGSFMPWLDAERIGAFRPFDYIFSLTALALPSLLFAGGLMVCVSALSRSLLLTYASAIAFLVLYIVSTSLLSDPETLAAASLLDPFGFAAFQEATRYWTISDRNTSLIRLDGLYLWNRILWTAGGLMLMAVTLKLFRFRTSSKSRIARKAVRLDRPEPGTGSSMASRIARLPRSEPVFDSRSKWLQVRTRLWFETRGVVKSVPFLVLLLLSVANTLGGMFDRGGLYGTDLLPVTRAMINSINSSFSFLVVLIVIYYSAGLVWQERQVKFNEVIDATPTPSWVFVVTKLFTVFVIVLSMFAVSILTAIAVQVASGYTNFELGFYAQQLLFYQSSNLFLIAVLSVFAQVLTNNRYLGMLLMVLYLIGTQVLSGLGFEHNLYLFAGRPPAPLSDMNGAGHFLAIGTWFTVYWGFCAVMLAILSYLMWNRGTVVRAGQRWAQIRIASSPATVLALSLGLTGFVATGAYTFYNTNVLNEYRTQNDREMYQIEYEKRFRRYEFNPKPRIVAVDTDVDIYPHQRRYEIRGTYVLENRNDFPLTEIQVVFDPRARVHELDIDGASLAWEDEGFNYSAFALNKPMVPGDRLSLHFRSSVDNPGFRNDNNLSKVVDNGTFIDSNEATPALGFVSALMLTDRQKRRDHGLQPVDRLPKLDDPRALRNSYLRPDSDWVSFDTRVSTVPDQIAVAPGYLEREWEENGRRYFHYRMDAPIQNYYAYLSADYQVVKDHWNDVEIAVYYHRPHVWNIERMIEGVKASLDYFSREFSPYQYRQLRVLEFPAYGNYAQSFPNTIPYSEGIGFVADIDKDDIDYVFYVTAHEVAHQWWAHQVMGADTQGGTVVVETLSQYSALMVMERKYGPQMMRRFLQYELDRYLRGRGTETQAEMPLMTVEDQDYINYEKGALVMYALKDYLGEDAVNRALRKLIANHAYRHDPYTTSLDLVGYLREEAVSEEQQNLITDLFERIVLFDLRVVDANVSSRADGRYDVAVTIAAREFEADGEGRETEIPLDMSIDVGAFSMNPADARPGEQPEIYLEKHRVTQGESVITLTLDRAPVYVGIDPYNKLIDRNSNDNVKAIVAP